MSEKILVIEDFTVRGTDDMHVFDKLKEKYDVELKYITVQKDIETGDDFAEFFLQMEKNGPDVIPEEKELVNAIEDADIVISHISALNTAAINSAKHLKAACIMRSGVENINLPNAIEKGIKVVNAPGRLAVPVSEFTVGLIISEIKNIARSHQRMQKHIFDNDFPNAPYSINLKGKNIGIIGCGAVGKRVAQIMKAFEANVLVYDSYMADEKIKEMGYTPVGLDELCSVADVISMHYRLTEESKGLLGKEQFAKMKKSCFLINTARAGLIEEECLMDALVNHKIAGAGLDVFHEEPLSEDNLLLSLDNVTITNHMAGHCADILQMTADIMMDTLEHYLQTGEWKHVVN